MEATTFLELCALELIRSDGMRVVKGPGQPEGAVELLTGMPEWDQILVADGAGVQPSVFAFARGDGLEPAAIQDLQETFVRRVTGSHRIPMRVASIVTLRVVSVFVFSSLSPAQARRISRVVPRQFYPGVRPQVWVVDLAAHRLWTPRRLRPAGSAERAVRLALEEAARDRTVDLSELRRAEYMAESQRSQFISRIRKNAPLVTYTLLGLIWLVFVFELMYPGGPGTERDLLQFGALQPTLVEHGEWWLLLTAMFVHVSYLHIGFNSIALYSIGTLVERIYGAVRFAVIYFVSGLVASLASFVFMVLTNQPNQVAAGASGAIFGLAGVVIVLGVLRHSIVPRAVALQLSLFMLVLIVVNIGFDAFTPGIDIRAHIGGLVVGLILGYFMAPREVAPSSPEPSAQWSPEEGAE
ncbi:MAG TPA: rhomboid family intramembrane serine protease [Chloroflexota bacterium]|nr:rhomboid family intramembrane serine protease [Chloroflexota bacterium]